MVRGYSPFPVTRAAIAHREISAQGGSSAQVERFVRLLSPEQRDLLNNICKSCAAQPPDLLLYAPDLRDFWFAEIKGPRDDLSEKRRRSHTAITEQLKVSVEMIEVRI